MKLATGAIALILLLPSAHAEGWKLDRCSRDDLSSSLQKLKNGKILFGAQEEASIRNLGRKLMEIDGKNGKLYALTASLADRRMMDLVNDRDLIRAWKETMVTRMASLFITRPSSPTGENKGNNRGTLPELTQEIANTSKGAAWCAAFLSFATQLTECAMQESLGELISPFTDRRFAEIDARLQSSQIPNDERDSLMIKKGVLSMNTQILSNPMITQGLSNEQSWLFDAVNNAFVDSIVFEARKKGFLTKNPQECRAGMLIAWVNVNGRNKPGHIGIIREVVPQKRGVILRTVEANTSAGGSDDNERVGGSSAGVFPKRYGPTGFNLPGSRKTFQGCIQIF